jgi:hypothetical protein
MPYIVKWRATLRGHVVESPTAYPGPAAAVDFACAQFGAPVYDIWIEGPNGVRIERNAILKSRQDQGPRRAPVKTAAPAEALLLRSASARASIRLPAKVT